jgi:putative transcriptional regulator
VSTLVHPDDAMLAQYATGGLRPGFDLVVAAHLETCAGCRATVGRFEAAAGELMGEAPAEPLADDALAHMLARLEREPKSFTETPDRRPLVERLQVEPKRWLGPGSWVQPVVTRRLPGDKVYFLRVAAGLQGISHGHEGMEATAIIQGALEDEGVVYPAGSFLLERSDVVHQPRAERSAGPCLCLIATQGRLTTRDWLSALIKSWAGV